MSGLAALPMYDWPEVRAETDDWWRHLRDRVGATLPATLTRPDGAAAVAALWRDPRLVFAQTCWGPLRAGLAEFVRVLAQPDYGDVPGGRGPYYRSALVMREADAALNADAPVPSTPATALPRRPLAGLRLAANGPESLSGFLALAEDCPAARDLAVTWTSGHRASVRAVAKGAADLAAIDCRSWALARRFEPAAAGLRVVGWTAERLGLPYVTSRRTAPALVERLRAALIAEGCHRPQEERAS